MKEKPDENSTIRELHATFPRCQHVLLQFGIRCGQTMGNTTLRQLCEMHDIDVGELLAAITNNEEDRIFYFPEIGIGEN